MSKLPHIYRINNLSEEDTETFNRVISEYELRIQTLQVEKQKLKERLTATKTFADSLWEQLKEHEW